MVMLLVEKKDSIWSDFSLSQVRVDMVWLRDVKKVAVSVYALR